MTVFVFVVLIAFWRTPDRLFDGYLWAEDAVLFLKSAYQGGGESLVFPYAGYMHLLPRLIAYVQTLLSSPMGAPYFYVWTCVFLTAFGVVYSFRVAVRTGLGVGMSMLFAFAPFYIVHSGEVFWNITNLQWVLAPLIPLLLIDVFLLPQKTYYVIFIKSAVLFVLGLTGPFSVLFVPVAVYVLLLGVKNFDFTRKALPAAAFFASTLIQVWVTAKSASVASVIKPHAWVDRLLFDYMAQNFFTKAIFSHFGGAFVLWLTLVLLLICILVAGKNAIVPVALIFYSVVIWVIGVVRVNNPDIVMSPLGAGSRYYFTSSVFLAWGLIACIKYAAPVMRIAPSALLACLFFSGMSAFNADVHKTWSIVEVDEKVYKVSVPPGWQTYVRLPK